MECAKVAHRNSVHMEYSVDDAITYLRGLQAGEKPQPRIQSVSENTSPAKTGDPAAHLSRCGVISVLLQPVRPTRGSCRYATNSD